MRITDKTCVSVCRKFLVSERDGRVAELEPVPSGTTPLWARGVSPKTCSWNVTDANKPFFAPPIPFVVSPPEGSGEPFLRHNHCPAITWCPNGDLLAAWFSCEHEHGTEMTILASRLRAGAEVWEPSAEFFKAADRNMTGTALLNDGQGTLYHFNGMGPAGIEGWENLVVTLRASADNGDSWTPPRVISPGARYQRRNQVIAGTSITPDGMWLQPCDGTPGGEGPSAVHVSRDGGETWDEPGGDIRG
ncbi:MAG: exo-alpha-sialidase, partial [Victivallales bacterium]|nr:exo-alpha-sialidase [Victivallales bacterium]